MKTDTEVQLMLRTRTKGKTLEQAAARAGMSVPTARKYLRAAALPSQLRQPRDYRTRPNPFLADWSWVEQQLQRDSVAWLQELARKRNQTRQLLWATELDSLRPLPSTPLHPCRELPVTVTRFSTIRVLHNTYSVPSRLIGVTLTVRVRAETLELYVASTLTLTLPRLHGRFGAHIDYRHLLRVKHNR